ncbi:MAG: response regulator [Halobacteriota archaeon]
MTSRILIVEDESIVAMDVSNMLEKLGYTVSGIVGSGEEAIQSAKERVPDLVLMDIMLRGEVDGIEAAEYIRHNFHIPVVYVTAYSDSQTLERAKITEPYGYILKPFEERELHTCIEITLYKHKMEERLRRSKEWFSTTLKSLGEAVIATDTEGRITYMNPVAEESTGWRMEEALNRRIEGVSVIRGEESGELCQNPVLNAAERKKVVNQAGNSLLVTIYGKEIPIDYNAAPIIDDKGDCAGVVLVFKDVSERRKAEETIKRRLGFEKTIADISSQFVGIFDIKCAMDYALKRMGKLSGASGACLFLYEMGMMEKTCEWRASEIKRIKPQKLSPQKFSWLMEKINNGELVHIDVEKLPEDAHTEKETFEEWGIKSFIGSPVYVGEKPDGIVCFDDVSGIEWSDEDLAMLRVFSEILGSALERKKAEDELKKSMERLQKSMKATISATSRIYQKITSKPSRYGKNPGF